MKNKIYISLISFLILLMCQSLSNVAQASSSISGVRANDSAEVIATGDFDADGKSDIAVCIRNYTQPAVIGCVADDPTTGTAASDPSDPDCDGHLNIGGVFIFTTIPGGTIDYSTTPIQITGEVEKDYAGSECVTVDANGDGTDDLVIGATGNDTMASDAGAVYVIFGNPSLASTTLADTSIVKITGEITKDEIGLRLANAGDVNADGIEDILIGAFQHDSAGYNSGAAYIVPGSSTLTSMSLIDPTIIKFTGANAGDLLGYNVAGVGDINADGIDDMLISSVHNDDAASNAGAAYLIHGDPLLFSKAVSAPGILTITGETANDMAGYRVAKAGDVDGDGHPDLLISAFANDDGGSGAGAVYLVPGSATHTTSSSISLSDSSIIQFTGENAGDNLGRSIAGDGDIDGDGYADILIGASYNDDGGNNAGAVYLIHGSPSIASVTVSATVDIQKYIGNSNKDYFGSRVQFSDILPGTSMPTTSSFSTSTTIMFLSASGNNDAANDAGKIWLMDLIPGSTFGSGYQMKVF
jgi:hypothetical protein